MLDLLFLYKELLWGPAVTKANNIIHLLTSKIYTKMFWIFGVTLRITSSRYFYAVLLPAPREISRRRDW